MRINSTWSTSIALLLAFATSGAIAGDGERRNNRDDMREQRQAIRQERLRDVRGMQQQSAQQPQQQPQQFQPQNGLQPQQPENARRGGRMSPEDRRALRRQIDQASHDVYGPGR